MKLELGCPVHGSDGRFGELADVVIDPTRRRVTHLVVKPYEGDERARLVPVELASAGDAPEPVIAVRATADELRRLPLVEEVAYVRFGEFPLADPDWDVGVQNVLAQPYYDYPGFGGTPPDFDPHVVVTYDRVPKGEVEIRRGSGVFSADDHRLGHVDGFLVDGDDQITHVVLERGHLFGRREVTIPIGAVARVENDAVTLTLTKGDVARLPTLPVRRWAARAAHR